MSSRTPARHRGPASTGAQPPWAESGDAGPGSALLTGDPNRSPSAPNGDQPRGLTVRIADLPARPRRRGALLSSRRPRRARYLIASLLVLPLLGTGGYYLASGNAPAAPSASGAVTGRPAPASCVPAQAAPTQGVMGAAASAALAGAMGPAVLTAQAAAPCGGQPFGAVTASPSVPQSAHPVPSRARSR